MTLFNSSFPLTYCTNVHPIQNLDDIYQMLDQHTVPLQRELYGEKPMGVGLWFPQGVARELEEGKNLADLAKFLEARHLFAFTLNGFPQNLFHSPSVKEKVYFPTWAEESRLEYSKSLARILAFLLPPWMEYGSISTLPLHFKETKEISLDREVENLLELVATLHQIKKERGKHILFCLEPEPLCALETTDEVVDFFQNHLFKGREELAKKLNLSPPEALEVLKDHLGLCWDTCHQAVEFEDPLASLGRLKEMGLRVGKVQLSNALEVHPLHQSLEALRKFSEERYLHQVIGRDEEGSLHRARDLPEIFEDPRWKSLEILRIHFHIPLFCRELPGLSSTLDGMYKSLDFFLNQSLPVHLEVETYTWDVLPEREKQAKEDLWALLGKELRVVLEYLGEK